MTGIMRTAVGLLLLVALAACSPRMAAESADAGDARIAQDMLVMPDGARLPLHVWEPHGTVRPKAVVLGVHGFNDYGMGFDLAGEWFAAQDIKVYAYDQRGFGAAPHPGVWPSEERLARDLGHAVRLIKDRHPDTPVYVLGVSMGGAVALAAADQGHLPQVAGVVLSAPAVWARETMPFYQRWALWLGAHTVPWVTLTGAGLDRSPTDNTRVLRTLAVDPKVIGATRIDSMYGLTNLMDTALHAGDALAAPALVLYGANDEIVPPEPTLRFWQTLKDRERVRLALYDEGWHMLLRDTQAFTVWHDIRTWMAAPKDPLPSGADEGALERLRTLADER